VILEANYKPLMLMSEEKFFAADSGKRVRWKDNVMQASEIWTTRYLRDLLLSFSFLEDSA
jgi:hypothetical protein